ncbi:PREDICTED: RING finger protein 37-like [Priapulus caudatus]|uniref:RING finger protein 37-like n=1 Tax=Priapulus caudatus TaxID=37621 RepID=A0ABM1DTV9_PRICU|nr:PREDICTED: RING finger protein 37-like [Priapulus caudatus]
MSINFCASVLGARIHCAAVSCDGYEPDNLLRRPSRGFLAERFVRPPVTITVTLPLNVDVSHVVVTTTVGAQTTTGLEILAAHGAPGSPADLEACLDGGEMPDWRQVTFAVVARASSRVAESPPPSSYVFVNARFRETRSAGAFGRALPVGGTARPMRHRDPVVLARARHVAVRITSTAAACVPALGSVEIWGQPAAGTAMQLVRELTTLHRSLTLRHVATTCSPGGANTLAEIACPPRDVAGGPEPDCDAIPPDFLDAITFEVMSLPVLLPSGHTVDRRTLERHAAEEERWGRPPSDPFTGVRFSRAAASLPNTPLKARIDAFLLRRPDVGRRVGRTSGRATHHGAAFADCRPDAPPTSAVGVGIPEERRAGRKRQSTDDSAGMFVYNASPTVLRRSTSARLLQSESSPVTSEARAGSGHRLTPQQGDSHDSCVSKENTVRDDDRPSLDSVLSATLNSLPSFRLRTKTSEEDDVTMCSRCRQQSGVFYRPPCGHSFCRSCLLKDKHVAKVCDRCEATFTAKDFTRVHV